MAEASPSTTGTGLATVTPGARRIVGGSPAQFTVVLPQPAPDGGLDVQLASSDPGVIAPATVRIPFGRTSRTVALATTPVSASSAIGVTASLAGNVSGTSIVVDPATTLPFTLALQPTSVTAAPGQSRTVKITTTITAGYAHSLRLTASTLPAGVTVAFTPRVIPAPGAGTSKAVVKVAATVPPGTYSIRFTATDGTASRNAKLTLKVASTGPGATFRGCWYKESGHRYQGVQLSVANPGTYPFDAVLYRGPSCDPAQFADEFGYGTPLNFGGFGFIFWFADFADETDTSAIWHVGNNQSQCVNYAAAPDC